MAFPANDLPVGCTLDSLCLMETAALMTRQKATPVSLEGWPAAAPLQRRQRDPNHTPIAALMRRRVSGNSRIRTPVASASALPMAAAVGPCADSPVPRYG